MQESEEIADVEHEHVVSRVASIDVARARHKFCVSLRIVPYTFSLSQWQASWEVLDECVQRHRPSVGAGA